MELQELRNEWEEGLVLVTNIELYEDTIIVILKDSKPVTYHMMRYFKLGNGWEVSCDCRSENVDDVFKMLAHIIKRIK